MRHPLASFSKKPKRSLSFLPIVAINELRDLPAFWIESARRHARKAKHKDQTAYSRRIVVPG